MKNLKYVKGVVQQGQPADIYFYTDVDGWRAEDFISELSWLENYGVSKINVHINSCGGSIVDGMGVFSRILDCKVATACYNDGLAASMGSIIWAAGQDVYMKDYALLMIHNPFIDNESGKEYNQITEAFKKQLTIIYRKRFGLSDQEIEDIMNGTEGNDGTFFTADEAVEKGFVSASHIIETKEAVRAKVDLAVKDGFDITKLKAVMNCLAPMPKTATIQNNINSNKNKMNDEQITVFAALLGINGEKATVEGVSAKINALKNKAGEYDTLKASFDNVNKELTTVKTELAGSKASVKNLTADLQKANDALKVYKEAEAKAQETKINALIDGAINACKIDKADKETWVKMAQDNFDLAKKVLDSIAGRDKISNEIAKNSEEEAKKGLESEEEKAKAKVDELVGKDFQFHHLGD